ncbi:phage tail assembly protein T [Streptomyces violaceus]|uniref:DUF4035 domain-containing protein n=1 Tax=Streptomyces violaceus TaxID=1936 RepID=A0ABY9UE43_STRVL|nr:DUF4035 domain-containing protein [Streptomyces janthinus]WND21168.1 DUF4035 domain-containing protein [Streptomyces janthinus]GGS47701.1 hypothetical protein GCM10010270_17190 [Streptomyces janthinus]
MLADIGSAELAEWQAYERLTGPLGGARGDVQAALIASTIAAVNRNKGQKAPKVTDFMPRWDKGAVRKSPQELFKIAQMANAALGGGFNSTTA